MNLKTALSRIGILLPLLLTLSLISFSQNNFKVSGKVSDETGKPVQGATVQVKSTAVATATSADGSYSLMVPSGNSILVITSVGFDEIEVPIANKSEVNVSIRSNASALGEVYVTVGYATVNKKDVTGSGAAFNQKDIRSRPCDNA